MYDMIWMWLEGSSALSKLVIRRSDPSDILVDAQNDSERITLSRIYFSGSFRWQSRQEWTTNVPGSIDQYDLFIAHRAEETATCIMSHRQNQ